MTIPNRIFRVLLRLVVYGSAGSGATRTALGLEWPADMYSLSHAALPFPPDDPLCGGPDAGVSPGIRLGRVALRGERSTLQISADDVLRLHWNPFYVVIDQRLREIARALAVPDTYPRP